MNGALAVDYGLRSERCAGECPVAMLCKHEAHSGAACRIPLHCRLRYFDSQRQRAGVPEDVAALVEAMGTDEVTVMLVNMNQSHGRTVMVQGGAYAEHQIHTVAVNEIVTPLDQAP